MSESREMSANLQSFFEEEPVHYTAHQRAHGHYQWSENENTAEAGSHSRAKALHYIQK